MVMVLYSENPQGEGEKLRKDMYKETRNRKISVCYRFVICIGAHAVQHACPDR